MQSQPPVSDMEIIYQLREHHIAQLHQLYQLEWWTRERTLDETRRCVAGSQICIGMTDNNNDLAGFTRVLTDYTFKALIFDVIVRHDRRGNHLGDTLISLVKEHEKLQDVKHFELYCLPDMHAFYTRHGFSTQVGDIRLMRLINT